MGTRPFFKEKCANFKCFRISRSARHHLWHQNTALDDTMSARLLSISMQAFDGNLGKTCLKSSMYPLMYLFEKNSMPDVDNSLTSFWQLDDEACKEIVKTIQFKLQYHKDPERAEQIKQMKGW